MAQEGSERDEEALESAAELPAGSAAGRLAALAARAAPGRDRLPPVERWNPPDCGDIDIVIDREGGWHYMGTPIAREALVRLFSTVLRREPDGRFCLVTPVEKVGIRVEDVPFLAVEMGTEGEGRAQAVTFRTNVGDLARADADHPLRFSVEAAYGGLVPYVLVRGALEARLTRGLLHEIAALISDDDPEARGRLGVWSGGGFHAVPEEALLGEAMPDEA